MVTIAWEPRWWAQTNESTEGFQAVRLKAFRSDGSMLTGRAERHHGAAPRREHQAGLRGQTAGSRASVPVPPSPPRYSAHRRTCCCRSIPRWCLYTVGFATVTDVDAAGDSRCRISRTGSPH